MCTLFSTAFALFFFVDVAPTFTSPLRKIPGRSRPAPLYTYMDCQRIFDVWTSLWTKPREGAGRAFERDVLNREGLFGHLLWVQLSSLSDWALAQRATANLHFAHARDVDGTSLHSGEYPD